MSSLHRKTPAKMVAKKKVPAGRQPAKKKRRKQRVVVRPSVDLLGDDEDETPSRREPRGLPEEDGPGGVVMQIDPGDGTRFYF